MRVGVEEADGYDELKQRIYGYFERLETGGRMGIF